jgi:hypothetical protein
VLGALGYYGQVTGKVDQIGAFGEEIYQVRFYQGERTGKDFHKVNLLFGLASPENLQFICANPCLDYPM